MLVVATSCVSSAPATPTPTATATATVPPTATATATAVPVPTATETAAPTRVPVQAPPPPPAAALPTGGGNVANGQALFLSVGCATCHRSDGSGFIGPRVANTSLSFQQVLSQIRNPRENMQPFSPAELNDAQVRDIYAFLKSLP